MSPPDDRRITANRPPPAFPFDELSDHGPTDAPPWEFPATRPRVPDRGTDSFSRPTPLSCGLLVLLFVVCWGTLAVIVVMNNL